MIFILKEYYTGEQTIPYHTDTYGIEANTFEEAKSKVKGLSEFHNIRIIRDDNRTLKFDLNGLLCEMDNIQLEMLK